MLFTVFRPQKKYCYWILQ